MNDVDGGARPRAASDLDRFCVEQYPRLVGSLTLYCGSQEVAQVIAQDALVKLCERWGAVSGMVSPGAWLHRVAINAANSQFTRQRAERRAMQRFGAQGQQAAAPDPADAIAVRAAVAQLSPRRRQALVLRYFADFTVEQTALAMRCRPGTVRALTAQALQQLRDSGQLRHNEDIRHGD